MLAKTLKETRRQVEKASSWVEPTLKELDEQDALLEWMEAVGRVLIALDAAMEGR